ncbi:MAG: acyloxyacyl hydrolase [Armatimonadota bacterium]
MYKQLLFIGLLAVTLASRSHAERFRFDSVERGLKEITLIFAYAETHKIPSAVTKRARLDQLRLRIGKFVSPRDEYAIELSALNETTSPDNRGWSVIGSYRRLFCVRGSTAIGFDVDFGLTCFQKRLITQSTRINFTEQMGVTVHYATGPRTAFSISYLFSHNSNAGLRMPNLGINASILSLGISWYLQ